MTLEGSGSAAEASRTDTDKTMEHIESTDEIRADIEVTRYEMGDTLEALGEKLDPGRMVREATIGRVEGAVETVGETTRGTIEMVIETIKRNPIPAAIAGAGLALLWMNRVQTDGRHTAYRYTDRYSDRYSDRYPYQREPGVVDRGREAAGSVGEGVKGAASSVGEGVSNVALSVGEGAQQAAGEVAYRGREAASQLGTQFDRILQSNPLALGAVALGAGAVVGTLVPETQQEREMLGEASQKVGSTVRDSVSDAMSTVEEKAAEAEEKITSNP